MVVGLNNLCTPAYVYLMISAVALVVMAFQNMGSESIYCLGSYSCDVSSTTFIFVVKMCLRIILDVAFEHHLQIRFYGYFVVSSVNTFHNAFHYDRLYILG